MTSKPISQINRPSERRDTLRRAIGSRGGVAAVLGFLLRAIGMDVRSSNSSDELTHELPKRAQTLVTFRDDPAFRCSVLRLVHPSILFSELEA